MSLNNLSSALSVHDIESDLHYVEIVYKKWNSKRKEYDAYTDYINTEPIGDWTKISWKSSSPIDYYKFLDVMVVKTWRCFSDGWTVSRPNLYWSTILASTSGWSTLLKFGSDIPATSHWYGKCLASGFYHKVFKEVYPRCRRRVYQKSACFTSSP